MARVEAVLFLAGEPLSSRKLAQFAGLADGTEARTLLRRLNQLLDAAGSAFRVEEVAGGFQMLTRAKFGPWLRRFHQTVVQQRISASALETLAVVAYRQPVLRAEIEAVRGVQCGEMLRQLMERDLVRISGRSPDLGRPFLYATTRRFLQVFGLRHVDELPRAAALRLRTTDISTGALPAAANILKTSETQSLSCSEERAVTSEAPLELSPEELIDHPAAWAIAEAQPRKLDVVNEDEDDDLDDDDEDEDDEDEDDDDEDDDDLEDDDWEEVDDDEEDEDEEEDDFDEDEDDDWDDDEEDDEDWDDDDDDDDEDEDEDEDDDE